MAIQQISWPQAQINSNADFTPLAKLGEIYGQTQAEGRRLSALQSLTGDPSIDTPNLMHSGDFNLAQIGINMQNRATDDRRAETRLGFEANADRRLTDAETLADQNRATVIDLGKRLAAGKITYEQAAGEIAKIGDVPNAINFLKLAEVRRKQDLEKGASAELNNVPGFGAGPRTEVPVIPGTIRTNPDGTIAGNITAPTIPAPPVASQAAPAAPTAPAPAAPTAPAPAAPTAPAPIPDASAANATAQVVPTMAHVPTLMRLLPRLPPEQQKMAEAAIKYAWDNAKPTAEIATLKSLQSEPELLKIATDLAKAKATNQTVNMPPQEKRQDEKMGEVLSKYHGDVIDDTAKSYSRLQNLDAAERTMTLPGYVSGTAKPLVLATRRILSSLGVEGLSANAGPIEMFDKLQNKVIMDSGGNKSGLGPQISDNDVKIISGSTFNAQNTEAGNRMIIGFQKLLEKQKPLYLAELNKYAKDHGGRIDVNAITHMHQWAQDHPLDYSSIPGFAPPQPDPIEVERERRMKSGNYNPGR